jgi:hypothetical protein
VEPYNRQRASSSLVMRQNGTRIVVVSRRVTPPSDIDGVLHVPGGEMPNSPAPFGDRGRRARWLTPKGVGMSSDHAAALQRHCEQVRTSWRGQCIFRTEPRQQGDVVEPGLRSPHMGALHAALAQWTVTDAPAPIVSIRPLQLFLESTGESGHLSRAFV